VSPTVEHAPADTSPDTPHDTPPGTGPDAAPDPRTDAGRTLAGVAAERDARRAALDVAENDYAAAHAAALEAGWTAAELTKVGLGQPDARAVRRLRRRADVPAGGAA
jgi:hypothetical protein